MGPRLEITELRVLDLRNLDDVRIEPSPGLNVIFGSNGHGKTSLLEAIYLVATSRSFRTARSSELVRHAKDHASVRARFLETTPGEPSLSRDQIAAIERGSVVVKVDQNRPASLAEYATRSPIVAFHPAEMTLASGPASKRRTLLDRLALFVEPSSGEHRARYTHAIKARQELLKRRGEASEIEAFEALAARHGAALTRARAHASKVLEVELLPAFGRIAAPSLALSATYAPGGSPDAEETRAALASARGRDTGRPSASFGPHRDDLDLCLNGHPAKVVGSQGQLRALTLALKAAETRAIAAARGVEPILLLDDVSSELDPDRNEALFTFLGSSRGQVFLTTTRRDLIATRGASPHEHERRDFYVHEGKIALAE